MRPSEYPVMSADSVGGRPVYEFYARARAVLLPDGLSGAGWRTVRRREEPTRCCNPLVGAVIWRTRSVLTLAFPKARLVGRSRPEVEQLVSAIIDEVATAHAIGLSPEERDEAVTGILDEHLAASAGPTAPAAAGH
jgi:hypothetical protein